MRFLLDESADLRLAVMLEALGHDVASVRSRFLQGLDDRDVLALANVEQRVLLTFDRDFGELVVQRREPHSGVIYLRLGVVSLVSKYERVLDAIRELGNQDTPSFLVVTPTNIRRALG